MNIYVGNLNYRVREADLQQIMEDYGTVTSVKVIMDRETGKSKGFGFIKEVETGEKYFVHISGLIDKIKEGNLVTYDLEKGAKGMNAVNVKKI